MTQFRLLAHGQKVVLLNPGASGFPAVGADKTSRRYGVLLRQQILILHLSHPDLDASTIAWALYDGAAPADRIQMQSGDQKEPPYRSVLAAMRDGWFVLQLPTLPHFERGEEHETGHLPYEYVLERKVEVHEQS